MAEINDLAAETGSKLRPIESIFCTEHSTHHIVELHGSAVDDRFQLPPVDVPMSDKPHTFKARRYCEICCAYHGEGERCGGPRTAIDWSKREIQL